MSWDEVSLTEVCDFQGGTQPPKSTFIYEPQPGYVRLIQIQDFKTDDKQVYIPDRGSLKKCQKTDVMLARYGASVGQILTGLEGAYNVALIKTLPDKGRLERDFLLHLLRGEQFQKFLSTVASRAAQAGFNKDDLARFRFFLPPLPEQKRIAAILDKADAIRRKRDKAIELTDSFLRSVFLEMFGDPESNPHGFGKGTIRDLVSEVKYGTSGKAGATGNYEILRMNNLTYSGDIDLSSMKRIDLEQNEEAKYLVRKGDLLFNRTNSKELVGKSAVYSFDTPRAIAGYLIRVRPNEKSNIEYIAAYLNSQHGKKTLFHMCKSIVGMANINAQELQDIEILIPPVELQNKFALIVENVRELKNKLRRSLKQSETLSASLSQGLFAESSLKVQTLTPLEEVVYAL